MVDSGTMIAMLSRDVRGALRVRPDDVELRMFARAFVESSGSCCAQEAMDAAVDAWVALGCPDPVAGVASCPHCGECLVAPAGDPDPWVCDVSPVGVGRCECCDVTFGSSWAVVPERVEMIHGFGSVPGM